MAYLKYLGSSTGYQVETLRGVELESKWTLNYDLGRESRTKGKDYVYLGYKITISVMLRQQREEYNFK